MRRRLVQSFTFIREWEQGTKIPEFCAKGLTIYNLRFTICRITNWVPRLWPYCGRHFFSLNVYVFAVTPPLSWLRIFSCRTLSFTQFHSTIFEDIFITYRIETIDKVSVVSCPGFRDIMEREREASWGWCLGSWLMVCLALRSLNGRWKWPVCSVRVLVVGGGWLVVGDWLVGQVLVREAST